MIQLRFVAPLVPLAVILSLTGQSPTPPTPTHLFGFRNFAQQAILDADFLAVPDPNLARQHLKALTSAPHWASSPEDYATAQYVAEHFKAAGLQTEIVPYSVLLTTSLSTQVEAFDGGGKKILSGPNSEHVAPGQFAASNPYIDKFQNDARVLPAYNDWSASGDVTAPVVYANYGRLSDFARLAELGISVKGKIVLVRYGAVYRGVKVYIAQQFGAAGMLIYSDPVDDGDQPGLKYPAGPRRPDSAFQRGSVQFLPIYPGDPTTPGVTSKPGLLPSQRIPTDKLQYDLPSVPVIPLSSADAAPILGALSGPDVPADWQGGLEFPYKFGTNSVTVHLHVSSERRLRTIWNVIGKIPGATDPRHLVIAGNHRDAWVYGASDPNSGTAAMLEAVHGLGVLLQHGWRPARTIILCSWDAEEEGMMGSTEWVEQHSAQLQDAVAYFNMDVAVSGTTFNAAAVPSLRQFLREIAAEVTSPAGGTVAQQWRKQEQASHRSLLPAAPPSDGVLPNFDLRVGNLGSGSDYTPFLEHEGVPSTDIGSDGAFSVYHSVFDNYDWFTRFADPTFAYTQQQARFFGLEILHMADADVLPLNYALYAHEVRSYIDQARNRALTRNVKLDFTDAIAIADRFIAVANAVHQRQLGPIDNPEAMNNALTATERALLLPQGLPRRPWYRHSIYAPGEFTGYEAVVIPGINEAIDAFDSTRAQSQLDQLSQALTRATSVLTPAATGH